MIDKIVQALIDAKQPRSEFVELMEQFNDPYLVLIGCSMLTILRVFFVSGASERKRRG